MRQDDTRYHRFTSRFTFTITSSESTVIRLAAMCPMNAMCDSVTVFCPAGTSALSRIFRAVFVCSVTTRVWIFCVSRAKPSSSVRGGGRIGPIMKSSSSFSNIRHPIFPSASIGACPPICRFHSSGIRSSRAMLISRVCTNPASINGSPICLFHSAITSRHMSGRSTTWITAGSYMSCQMAARRRWMNPFTWRAHRWC